MEKYYDKISASSLFVNHFIKYFSNKDIFSSEEKTKDYIKNYNKDFHKTIKKLKMTFEDNFSIPIYSYNGTIKKSKQRILIYLHGGSFIEEGISFQYKFSMKIAEQTNSTLICPIYTLAPKGNYKKAIDDLEELWAELVLTGKEINIIGDSAGGGLSLSFSQYLCKKNIDGPKNILLLSPWLDLKLNNPLIKEIVKLDKMTSIEGNQYAGRLWADNLDLSNYLVSPLYGNFNSLGLITIATGEFDTLKPDCILLKEILKKQTINYNYIEYKGQCHDFGMFPTREGCMLIKDFSDVIKGDFNGN